MVGLSRSMEEAAWGDDALLHYLEILRDAYESGEKAALFGTCAFCARFQVVIPDWAADALLEIEKNLEIGELRDLNEAFGWENNTLVTRKRAAKRMQYGSAVLGRLQMHRLNGATLSADDIFQTVADEVGISRRDVEDIYKDSGQFLKSLPREDLSGTVHIVARMHMPDARRYGRPLLRDKADDLS